MEISKITSVDTEYLKYSKSFPFTRPDDQHLTKIIQ